VHLRASFLRLVAACLLVAGLFALKHASGARAGAVLPEPFDPAAMDTTANACTDFFDYANGTWRKAHPIPPAYSEYGYIEALQDVTRGIIRTTLDDARANPGPAGTDRNKIGTFYGSCLDAAAIDRAGLRPLAPALAVIDGVHDRASLLSALASLRVSGVDVGFTIGGAPDPKNAEMVISEIDQAGIGLPERDYYFRDDAASQKIRAQYRAHQAAMLRLSGDAGASADAASAYALERILAKASKPAADLRDPYALYHPMHIDGLVALAPHLAMKTYFATARVPAVGIVTVSEPDFVRAVDAAVVSEPLAAWRAYLRWRLLDTFAAALPTPIERENFAFNGRVLGGATQQLPRWKRCVEATSGQLGEAIGRAYVAGTFPPSAKAAATDMSERIRAAYANEMEHLDWLSPATKKIALAKLQAMLLKVGYPDRWRDYGSFTVVAGDYFGNVARGNRFAYLFDKAQIGKPVDPNIWQMTPQTVDAYNAVSPNAIYLPAAQLQRPFFDEHAPDADNLGATGGGTVGHEMTHGFDDEGHKYDLHGNLANWWTPGDLHRFNLRANCVIKQFDDTVAVDTIHYQGKLDAGEAIADLGGVTIGYHALELSLAGKPHDPIDGFTPEQRYFLAFGQSWTESVRPAAERTAAQTDPHPLPRDRVNNTVANIPGWYDAFDCPKPKRPICEVW
jgi:predicted metalloendopeptidase